MTRVVRSLFVVVIISSTIFSMVSASLAHTRRTPQLLGHAVIVDHNQVAVVLYHGALLGKI